MIVPEPPTRPPGSDDRHTTPDDRSLQTQLQFLLWSDQNQSDEGWIQTGWIQVGWIQQEADSAEARLGKRTQ